MSAADIDPGSIRLLLGARDHARTPCPACSPSRKNGHQKLPVLSIDRKMGDNKSEVIVYKCHHCPAAGAVPADGERNIEIVPRQANGTSTGGRVVTNTPVDRTKNLEFPSLGSLPELTGACKDFLHGRGIEPTHSSLVGAHLFPARAYFMELGREGPAIAFPYIRNGEIYSVKLRSLEGKYFTSRGSRSTMYLDWLLAERGSHPVQVPHEELVIVEGELDAIALLQAGVQHVVSVPNGTSLGETADAASALFSLSGRLKDFRRVILAGDNDEPGRKLQAELARRLGRARCFTVQWPEGCKDANDTLHVGGEAAIKECLGAAVPMPIEGIVEATAYAGRLQDLYDGKLAQGLDTGLGPEVDGLFSVPFGFMTVLTGWPNDGKSQLLDNILVHLAQKHELKMAIWSPENTPEIHLAKLIEVAAGFPFFPGHGSRLNASEVGRQLEWVNSHFFFLEDSEAELPTIDSILDRIEAAVLRYGVRVAVIDPYNHIAKPAGDMQEVEWIRKLLIRIKRFAQSHELHVFLVAHPRQLPSGSRRFPPTGFHIAGGAQWNAITDFGITVYRPKVETDDWESNRFQGRDEWGDAATVAGGLRVSDSAVDFIAWKVRHKWHGKRGVARLEFDSSCGRYYRDLIDLPPQRARRVPARHWQDQDDNDL